MNTEYKLSYTATEIDEKLAKVDELKTNITASDVSTSYHAIGTGGSNPLTSTVEQELSRYALEINSINSNLENIMSDDDTLIVPYITLESGNVSKTDETNDWSDFKGFVIGVECTGGDGTQYCETKYIPRNYANISKAFKHVLALNYSSQYSFIGFTALNVSEQKVTFSTTAFSGWTSPRWFLFGVK